MEFTQEEVRLIEKSRLVHEQLIDGMLQNGIPVDVKTVGALTKVLGSLDKNITGVARIRVDNEQAKSNDEIRQMVAETILMNKKRIRDNAAPEAPSIPHDIKVTNPVQGEMEQGVIKTNYETFING